MAKIKNTMTVSLEEFGKKAGEYALDEFEYKGLTIRQWTDKIASGEYQPVKHGRWIWLKNYRDCEGDIYSQYKCSCCDFVVGNAYSIEDLTPFCGNCGADMRTDGDNDV